MPMKLLTKMLGVLALSAAPSLHAYAAGSCVQGQEPVGERTFTQAGTSYKAVLCWDATPSPSANGGKLRLSVYRGEQLAAQTTNEFDVEGQVRGVRFDKVSYVLSSKVLTIPVLVEARLRGTTFDQHSTELLLFTMEGQELTKVFSDNVAWESWGTQCEPDCIDSTKTRTVVILTDKTTEGLRDLKLRTRGTVTPHGQPDSAAQKIDKTTQMVFTGKKYEPVQ